jgi:sugar/nucleoside kinase (ribokinase family)
MFFALEGDRTLGRNESRPAALLDWRDYCKLHIIAHYAAVLSGARPEGVPFHVIPIGKVGADSAGDRLLLDMAAAGMDTSHVARVAERPTLLSVCFQYPDGSGGNITTSNAASSLLARSDIDQAAELFSRYGTRAIALAAPEVPLALRLHLLAAATAHGAFRVAALASSEAPDALAGGLLEQVDLLAVNEDEAAALAGRAWPPDAPAPFLETFASALGARRSGLMILLSAGARGAWAFDGTRWAHCVAAPVKPVGTAGAGDALLGTLLACLAAGLPLIAPAQTGRAAGSTSALDIASLAAAMSVTSPHSIHADITLDSLLSFARDLDRPVLLPAHIATAD